VKSNMNILAVDHGVKRIGLAWVDSDLGVVLPYGVLSSLDELIELIEKEKIDQIVVGWPLSLESEENDNTERVKIFVEELKKQVKIPVEFIDERFTTIQAEKMGGEASLDEKAAMLILQNYLDK